MTGEFAGYIGLGGNLSSIEGDPRRLFERIAQMLPGMGIDIRRRSKWYVSTPVGPGAQPAYVNGVWEIASSDPAREVLAGLHRLEDWFGRRREVRWGARVVDLDLLALGTQIVRPSGNHGLTLPHPRLAERAFVLIPLAEIAPTWRHPVSGTEVAALVNRLDSRDILGVNPA